MDTRAFIRSTRSRNTRARFRLGCSALGPSTARRKRPTLDAAAGIFPLLDDETARVVMSYLSAACLGDSALISKAWEASSSKDDLWRPFLSSVDPMSALGDERLQEMSLQYSCKQVVSELSTRLCSCCRQPTNGFFVLTCTRVCLPCFETDPRVKMSSLSFVRNHFLLSKSQEKQLPTLWVENAAETGCIIAEDSAMTLTLISAAKASAVNRWGSEEAFEDEMSARKAKAEAAYDARKQVFDNHTRGPVVPSADSSPPNGKGSSHHQPMENPRKTPSRPRILGLANEKNLVGDNQQGHHGLRGEKYGFFTVVNDAYFDSGPKVVITEDDPGSCSAFDSFWDEREGCDVQWSKYDRASEVHHGRKLVEALKTAEHGTTIEIVAKCCSPASGLFVEKSVRLIGARDHPIRTWNAPTLVIRAPSILRNVEVVYKLPPMVDEEDENWRLLSWGLVSGTSATLVSDALLEGCRMGQSYGNSMGYCVVVKLGRFVARNNTFVGGLCGIAVDPLTASIATTVRLDGNTFSGIGCDWGWSCMTGGLYKGPAFCHRIQGNDAVLAGNTFRGISTNKQIREHKTW